MDRRRRACVVLVVALAVATLLTPRIAAEPAVSATCPVSADMNVTLQALRSECDQKQIDGLYYSLPAGPMPGIAESHGYPRPCAGCESLDPAISLLAQQLWQGQNFYTTDTGGYAMNRVLGGHEQLLAYVTFGPSYFDGKPSIVLDYPKNVWFIRAEVRWVQEGLYLGYGYVQLGDSRFRFTNYILDTMHPELHPSDCLLCGLLPHRH